VDVGGTALLARHDLITQNQLKYLSISLFSFRHLSQFVLVCDFPSCPLVGPRPVALSACWFLALSILFKGNF
jgi:hypothetical protein